MNRHPGPPQQGAGSRRSRTTAAVASALLVAAVGCAVTKTPALRRPSFDVQKQALRELVPMGISREQTEQRVREAGIEGEFGISDSVFYCDFWKRDGEHWYMDAALYFDQSGRLYKIGRGQSETGVIPGADRDRARPSEADAAADPSGKPLPEWAESAHSESSTSSSSARRARRTPFADPADLR